MKLGSVTREELTRFLREAEKAHGDYERRVPGGKRIADWSSWYAEFIVNALREREEGRRP